MENKSVNHFAGHPVQYTLYNTYNPTCPCDSDNVKQCCDKRYMSCVTSGYSVTHKYIVRWFILTEKQTGVELGHVQVIVVDENMYPDDLVNILIS